VRRRVDDLTPVGGIAAERRNVHAGAEVGCRPREHRARDVVVLGQQGQLVGEMAAHREGQGVALRRAIEGDDRIAVATRDADVGLLHFDPPSRACRSDEQQ